MKKTERLLKGICLNSSLAILSLFFMLAVSIGCSGLRSETRMDLIAQDLAGLASEYQEQTITYRVVPKEPSTKADEQINYFANETIFHFHKLRNHYDGLSILSDAYEGQQPFILHEDGTKTGIHLAGIRLGSTDKSHTDLFYFSGSYLMTYFTGEESGRYVPSLNSHCLTISDRFAERLLGESGIGQKWTADRYRPLLGRKLPLGVALREGPSIEDFVIASVYSTQTGFGHGSRFYSIYGENLFFGYRYSHSTYFLGKSLDIGLGNSVREVREFVKLTVEHFPTDKYLHSFFGVDSHGTRTTFLPLSSRLEALSSIGGTGYLIATCAGILGVFLCPVLYFLGIRFSKANTKKPTLLAYAAFVVSFWAAYTLVSVLASRLPFLWWARPISTPLSGLVFTCLVIVACMIACVLPHRLGRGRYEK